jgi:hypothetical protein
MPVLQILKIISAIITIVIGVYSAALPRRLKGFTGLEAPGPRGITELRTVMGGLLIGLGLAPFLLPGIPQVYQTLGIMYLVMALVRAVSIIVDKSAEQSNVISLVTEAVMGIILVV